MQFDDEDIEKKIKKLCRKHKVVEPLEFLAQIAAGKDPRYISDLFDRVIAIEEQYGDDVPDEWDWLEIKEVIKERYKHFLVPVNESTKAANQLLEYSHAKKKQVTHSGNIETTNVVQPLTRKEIRQFTRKFNHRY